ncbi:MAG: RecX family transcriptional regulator [Allosphingosinicella sp.]
MAQTWRREAERKRKERPPLDVEGLERLALSYVGRYATTRAKLEAYLGRKVKERGWGGAGDPPLARIVERFAELGYVNDGAFAASRAASLARRGYGERRVAGALRAAGIGGDDAEAALAGARNAAWAAALRFAERKRLGPYAAAPQDRDARRKAAAAMLRAGHPLDLVRRLLDASPGEVPDPDL